MTGEKDVVSHEMASGEIQPALRSTAATQAPAEMPGVEEIARAIYERRNGHGCKPWSLLTKAHKEPYLGDAEAAHALFAPILAEKERLSERVRELALMLDKQMGTPCEQIRHQHMYAALTTVAEKRQDEADQQAARADAAEARALAAEAALKLVAEQDVTEIALDPDWPRRICAAAIRAQGE